MSVRLGMGTDTSIFGIVEIDATTTTGEQRRYYQGFVGHVASCGTLEALPEACTVDICARKMTILYSTENDSINFKLSIVFSSSPAHAVSEPHQSSDRGSVSYKC